jgi:hypothetical protein
MGLAIGDDGTRQREAHPGEPRNLRRGGAVEIDALTLPQGPGKREGRVAMGAGDSGGTASDELHFPGRRPWLSSPRP